MTEQLDWEAVGRAVMQRRAERGFRRQEDAAEAAGIGVTTWRQIEGAKQDGYRPVILAAVATALAWPADALIRIARGEPPEAPVDNERLDKLEAEVREIRQIVERIVADPPRRARAPEGGSP